MKNGDKPASPVPLSNQTESNQIQPQDCNGLTKREYFAGLAMQGLLAGGGWFESDDPYKKSIIIADELLKQLDKTPTP